MTEENAEEIKAIFQEGRQATKDFVDSFFDLSERLFSVLISNSNHSEAKDSTLPKRVMTKKRLAEFLEVSPRLISDLQNEGLPIVKLGRCVRFDVEEVLDWSKDKKKIQKSKFRVVK